MRLRSYESGTMSVDELSKFLHALLKNQIIVLQKRVEQQTFQRAEEIESELKNNT